MIPKSLKSFREEFPRQRQQMVTVLAEISFMEDDVGVVLSPGRFFSRMGQCVVYLVILARKDSELGLGSGHTYAGVGRL